MSISDSPEQFARDWEITLYPYDTSVDINLHAWVEKLMPEYERDQAQRTTEISKQRVKDLRRQAGVLEAQINGRS